MMSEFLVIMIAAMIGTSSCQSDFAAFPEPLRTKLFETYKTLRKGFHNALGTPVKMLQAAAKQMRVQKSVSVERFVCDVSKGRSSSVPTSVDKLRPGDVSVVGALGDSLTAAFGATATNPLQLFRENRGMAALAGGQGDWRRFLTMPNILKEFNPSLFGYSLGDSLSYEWPAQFNVAEGGAMTHDLPYMARELISRLTNDSRVDMSNHWKLISVLVGGNDYCSDMCLYDEKEYLRRRRQHLIQTLDLLRDNLPRTLVNLVVSPNPGEILPKMDAPPFCWLTHRIECPCIMASRLAHKQPYYRRMILQSQLMEMQIANMKRYEKVDFAVVAQPFLFNLTVPRRPDGKSDISYFSTDCFHLSQKGSARGGNALWNNMMEPVGSKSTDWTPEYQLIRCPSPRRPYIFTNHNSRP